MLPDYPVLSPERLQRFLTFLVNEDGTKVLTRFPDFFPKDFESRILTGRAIAEVAAELLPQVSEPAKAEQIRVEYERHGAELTLKLYSLLLRLIWVEQDQRARQWRIFVMRYQFHRDLTDETPLKAQAWGTNTVPPNTPFEQAMVYMDRHFERFRYCKNPECPAPFYISPTNKPTKFCSPDCTGPAKREARLRWYHANPQKGKKHGIRKAR